MNYKAVFYVVVFFILTGCAAQEEPVSTREQKTLITKDDYEDLELKPRKEEPVEVDYKTGSVKQNFDITPQISAQKALQNKFLSIAAFGSVDELKIRYENGARVNFRNDEGETALIKVLEGPYDDQTFLKLKYLVSVGAQVNFKGKSATSRSTTPLNAAVWKTSSVFISDTASKKPFIAEQILKYLIDEGAYVSGSDQNGRTPLHTAARSNNLFAAELLLASGAEVMQQDFDGKTPLDFAESREMKRILKEHGAVDTQDTITETHDSNRKDTNEQGRNSREVWEPLRDTKPF